MRHVRGFPSRDPIGHCPLLTIGDRLGKTDDYQITKNVPLAGDHLHLHVIFSVVWKVDMDMDIQIGVGRSGLEE